MADTNARRIRTTKPNSPHPISTWRILPRSGIRFLLAIHSACIQPKPTQISNYPNQIDSLGIILFLDYAGDGTQGHPVGPEVLCHTKGGQSHQGYADPLDHKIKQGVSRFYASSGRRSGCR